MKKYTFAIFTGILVLFACLGLGRFVFGMLLPDMKIDLNMSITQAGFLGTSNFIGYLSGLIFAGTFYTKFGASKLIMRSLLTQGVTMLLMAISTNYLQIAFLYFLSGFFGALTTISIMSYITQIVPKNIRGKAAGILYTGGGFAIVLSGYTVPFMERFHGVESWRFTWGIFAIITILIALVVKFGLQNKVPNKSIQQKQKHSYFAVIKDKKFIQIGGLYFCFGITYVIYITFFVLASVDKWHVSTDLSASFWILLGFLSMLSGPIFGILSDRIGRYKTVSIVFFIQTISNLIMALNLPASSLWISASLFGISVWAIPSIMAVLTAETFGIEKTASLFSKITLIFALGQILGPIGAGYITDLSHDFSYAFGLSSAVTFLAFLFSLYLIIKNKSLI